MCYLVFLLEELSAKEMLKAVVESIIEDEGVEPEKLQVKYQVFEGKQDLEKQLVRKLKYWQAPNTRFIVIRDQDSGDCIEVKQSIQEKVNASGRTHETLIRIVCRELESFYLGDLVAVEQGLGLRGVAKKQSNKKYRNPDQLNNAKQELKRLTQDQYQPLSGSRQIAPHLNLECNQSVSFRILIEGIRRAVQFLSNVDIE